MQIFYQLRIRFSFVI